MSVKDQERSPANLNELIDRIESHPSLSESRADYRPSRMLAAQLVAIRKLAGWTQKDLALRARVSPSRIAQLESGTANPSIQTVGRLLRRAGVALTLNLELAASPQSGEETVTTIRQRAYAAGLDEGEAFHVEVTAAGLVGAIAEARVDGESLTKEIVVDHINEVYEHPHLREFIATNQGSGQAPKSSGASRRRRRIEYAR